MTNRKVALINARARQTIATRTEVALSRTERRRGLLDRLSLDPAAALVLAPCRAIHTAFMRFPIDVLFVDREGCVRRIVRGLEPWRVAIAWDAYATIEMNAGALDSCDIEVGDRLYLEPDALPGPWQAASFDTAVYGPAGLAAPGLLRSRASGS